MPKCNFNNVAKQRYCNHTSAWAFCCKLAQNIFFLRTPLDGYFYICSVKCVFLDTINELSRSVKEFVAFNAKMRHYRKLTVMDK